MKTSHENRRLKKAAEAVRILLKTRPVMKNFKTAEQNLNVR